MAWLSLRFWWCPGLPCRDDRGRHRRRGRVISHRAAAGVSSPRRSGPAPVGPRAPCSRRLQQAPLRQGAAERSLSAAPVELSRQSDSSVYRPVEALAARGESQLTGCALFCQSRSSFRRSASATAPWRTLAASPWSARARTQPGTARGSSAGAPAARARRRRNGSRRWRSSGARPSSGLPQRTCWRSRRALAHCTASHSRATQSSLAQSSLAAALVALGMKRPPRLYSTKLFSLLSHSSRSSSTCPSSSSGRSPSAAPRRSPTPKAPAGCPGTRSSRSRPTPGAKNKRLPPAVPAPEHCMSDIIRLQGQRAGEFAAADWSPDVPFCSSRSCIASDYLDRPGDLPVYHERIRRKDGATLVRVRRRARKEAPAGISSLGRKYIELR